MNVPSWTFSHARSGALLLLLISTLAQAAPMPDSTDYPLSRLLELLEQRQQFSWQLDHEYDPYRRDHTLRRDPSNPQHLTLKADGTYLIKDRDGSKEGVWEIDPNRQTVTFWCKRVNGRPVRVSQPNSFHVKQFSPHGLVLSWQGRHGQMEIVYR